MTLSTSGPCQTHPEVMSVNFLNFILSEITVLFLLEVASIPFLKKNINRFQL